MISLLRNRCQKFTRNLLQKNGMFRSISVLSGAPEHRIGDKILGYSVKQIDEVPELNLTAIRLQHQETGADHLHIVRDDNNNCFGVSLKTAVQNDMGIPHILEHLTLCGSRNYPCRDPFFKMLNRSLSTFMNAFTGCDCTMYPFSTQNPKDFENLLKVYLDAIFYPNLLECDFRQEAWRLEHEDVKDKSSPIILKGVVYNEMKGVFSDSDQLYARRLLNKLYPSHTYSYESGGDPLSIPDLTREELVKYHSKYYHPSNSHFFTYGNIPLEKHLAIIENYVLKNFSKIIVENEIIDEKRWSQPREVLMHSRFDPMVANSEKQTTVSVNYLLSNITDTRESFALSILCSLLVDGPNAPFYRTLLEPGIGPDYSPYVGYDGHQRQSLFSVGLRGIAEKDVERVKNVIDSTFNELIEIGFPEERIKGILHAVELSTKHQTENFGLSCAMGINSLWNHKGDPVHALQVNNHVKWFVNEMKENSRFLQDKIAQHFKNNTHKLTIVMTPNTMFEKENREKEQKMLQNKLSGLSEENRAQIFKDGIELLKEKNEDASCLPCLQISDVQRSIVKTDIKTNHIGNVPVQLCIQPTNEVVYFRAVSNTFSLSDDYLELLPLFCRIVTKMGAGDRNYKEFDLAEELLTGGLSASVQLVEDPSNPTNFEKGVIFSSYCLERNTGDMFSLWKDIFNRINLENLDRLSYLIKVTAADLAQSITHQGHVYAMKKSCSSLSLCSHIREKLAGLDQVSFMKKLAELNNFEEIAAKLKLISKSVLQENGLRCSLNVSSNASDLTLKELESFLNTLQKNLSLHENNENSFQSVSKKTHFVLPLSVNYLSKAISTVPYCHKDFATLKTTAKLLQSKFLHQEIREKGGAYGGGSSITDSGNFLFYSYRDPNTSRTLNSFDAGVKWLLQGNYSSQDIDEAKLGVFGEVDKPIPPGSKGSLLFLNRISDDMITEFRNHLFAVTKSDVVAAAEKYLSKPLNTGITLIGPENNVTNTFDWIIHKE